jgi:hypothetical protein
MRKLKLSSFLFLVPALVIGPIILLGLIIHGFFVEWIYRQRRWHERRKNERRGAVVRINPYRLPPAQAQNTAAPQPGEPGCQVSRSRGMRSEDELLRYTKYGRSDE